MAKSWTKKKVMWITRAVVAALLLIFLLMTTLSDKGLLPFPFVQWRDFGSILGQSDTISDSPVSVHFINVGNADCTYIKTPDGNLLIDAGEVDDEETILSYLRKYRVERLDYVIATHPHADHIGSMAKVLKSFSIGKFIMPKMPEKILPTTDVYTEMLQALSDEKIPTSYAKAGEEITLGDAKIQLLSPLDEYDSINNMSIVVKFTYHDFTTLITGDAEQEVENDLLEAYPKSTFKSDVLKVGHHGSRSSSSPAFLSAVDAHIFFLPCGKGNSYGHPHRETLDKLKTFNGEIYRADYNGTLVVVSDGKTYHAISES